MHTFDELRDKHSKFVYKNYNCIKKNNVYEISFDFEIEGLASFNPHLVVPYNRDVDEKILEQIVFNIGMIESISYYKIACPKVVEIQCGTLSKSQQDWWKKLYYNGLGEFRYINNIDVTIDELFCFDVKEGDDTPLHDTSSYNGYLVPVGGGKDSVVSLATLEGEDVTTFHINTSKAIEDVIEVFNNHESDIFVKRTLDKRMLELNAEGYLNGHTPFSAMAAFVSFLTAFLNGQKYIALSNETSANESTVKDSEVNHQYSKSLEFEQDFFDYIRTVTDSDIHYFSLLRPLNELQIAKIFSKQNKYHPYFRSCNVGSKKDMWCGNCPKCLFVYIIMRPFLSEEELNKVFGTNLLNKESLDKDFRELVGIDENKPFECVGTREEVNAALIKCIKDGNDSMLIERYKDQILASGYNIDDLLASWEEDNLVPTEEMLSKVKKMLEG